ncbi:MAG: hypothetical protein ACREQ2_16465 [Candidatus Binatia bacterium]
MNEHGKWKILQIIPAQGGWKAVHCQELENKEIVIFNRGIVCWALVEPVGESSVAGTQVRGIEQGLNDLAVVDDLIMTKDAGHNDTDRNQYFLGYNDPDAHRESDYWIKQGHDRFRTEKEKKLET